MGPEEDIFTRRTLRPETLAGFGFTPEGDGWRYEESIMDGDFRAEVFVTPQGTVEGRVIDLAAGEEYLPIRAKAHTGPFVGLVREAYGAVLRRIAEACFTETPFASAQANRIAGRIAERYGEAPDYPFGDPPEPAVFRYPANRKWYAIVMRVRRQRVTKEPAPPEDTPFADVMNVKVGKNNAEKYTGIPGIYPAYHMSHTDWVSILLDGTVPDETVTDLIDASRNFALAKKAGSRKP
ncbi:MAG: MmcQ/YjbR family DNA-binding protein [Clostridia bacterium]|nr:MmcQ/YjbR family DNA-binding protein [Clostridia bacterium]